MPARYDMLRQRGQAIVEMIVFLGVAFLLVLGIWYLGKYHDIQAATIQAARYAAWERTAVSTSQMSDGTLQNQVRRRLFTWTQNPFRADDGATQSSRESDKPQNWKDHSMSVNLIDRSDDIRVNTTSSQLPGGAQAAVNNAFSALTGALSAVTSGERLPAGGLMRGTVQVRLANVTTLPAVLNNLNLNLTESNAVVAEGWDASGPYQASERARTFVLAGAMGQARALMQPVQMALSLLEPDMSELAIGRICPDIVPKDRVSGNTMRPMYQGAQPCYD